MLLEWGSCGRVAYVDGEPAGYVLYAPPAYFPGADAFPTAPVSEDAVLLATAMVYPEYAGGGLGRVLMQTVVKDLVKRGGIRALEAFGDTRAPAAASAAPTRTATACCRPTTCCGSGFKTQRAHARYPRMRLELKSAVTWRDEVEARWSGCSGVVRPARQPGARTRTPRRRRAHRPGTPGLGAAQAPVLARPPSRSSLSRSTPVWVSDSGAR